MSVATSIRDYMEIINTQIGPYIGENSGSIFSISSETVPQILKMCKDTVWYLVSFKGLRDNFYQPYLSSASLALQDAKELLHFLPFSGVQINSHLENCPTNALAYACGSQGRQQEIGNFFLTGLGNSFFISLPGSIGTLLILRRLITQGTYAGFAATLGSVLGSCSMMVCIIFGSRFLILSPAFLDLFFYLGLLLPGCVILRGLCFSDFRIIPLTDRLSLFSIGLMHFLLGVSNQSTLFKHLRDLTITPYPTRFFGIVNNFSGVLYILGFSIGSVIFAFSTFYGFSFLINWWLTRSTITRSRLMKWSENASIVFLTCFSISTFSYYGADFLLVKGLGVLPSDKVFSETVLAPTSLFKDPHNLTGVHALYPSNEFSLDPAPFDRPLDKLFRRSILLKQQGFKYRSFEELNYQGEKHWLHRGFRHGSAKPIKNVTLPAEKNRLTEGRALLRSLDKAIGWDSSLEGENNQKHRNQSQFAFTNLALEEIPFNFEKVSRLGNNSSSTFPISSQSSEKLNNIEILEDKFKRLFFGQIGLLPGRLPAMTYGPFDSQEMAHKRLAFTNPVYKALLSFDIDLFLQRQPATHSLSAEDEHNIYLKRQLLERYINTQRDYFQKIGTLNKIIFNNNKVSTDNLQVTNSEPVRISLTNEFKTNSFDNSAQAKHAVKSTNKSFKNQNATNYNQWADIDVWEPLLKHKEQFFTKSFANQTYKHQFKGTLEIIRQMFAVSLDCPEPSSVAGGGSWDKILKVNGELTNFFKDDKGLVIPRPINPRILKFDQPLYTRAQANTRESAILKDILDKEKNVSSDLALADQGKTLAKLAKGQNIYENSKTSESLVSLSHEELYNYLKKTRKSNHFYSSSSITSQDRKRSQQQIQKPFLEAVSISPFYVGWDTEKRHLMLTQRYLSRKDALSFYPQNFNSLSSVPNASATPDVQSNDKSALETGTTGVGASALDQFTAFSTWPVLKADPTDKTTTQWRIPSRSLEQMVALEEEARLGLEEPSDKNKGLGGSIEGFVDYWNKNLEGEFSQIKPSFRVSRWPTNITTPTVQSDLENFDQIENSLFTSVKRGGFIWPGGSMTSQS